MQGAIPCDQGPIARVISASGNPFRISRSAAVEMTRSPSPSIRRMRTLLMSRGLYCLCHRRSRRQGRNRNAPAKSSKNRPRRTRKLRDSYLFASSFFLNIARNIPVSNFSPVENGYTCLRTNIWNILPGSIYSGFNLYRYASLGLFHRVIKDR